MSKTENPRLYQPENPQHNPKLRDFTLYTDGSGHADGFGGAAALVINNITGETTQVALARNHTSTARMEHEALLIGLQNICEQLNILKEYHRDSLERKSTVFWISDREDLVLSCAGLYKRKQNVDLWHRQVWYEAVLDVHPFYAPRITTEGNTAADELAGACRALVKDLKAYFELTHPIPELYP